MSTDTLPMAPKPVKLGRRTPPHHTLPAGHGYVVLECQWCGHRSDRMPATPTGVHHGLMGGHGGMLDLEAEAECPMALPPVVAAR